jgi:hypothetical protein
MTDEKCPAGVTRDEGTRVARILIATTAWENGYSPRAGHPSTGLPLSPHQWCRFSGRNFTPYLQ